MLACDEMLSFQRHSGSDISMMWVLLHTRMESSLLHIDNFDVGFSGIYLVFFVCGPGMKKSVKDVCLRMGVFAFSVSPSRDGIAAASAAAYGFYFMFSIVCQVASRAAAAWRAGAFVYIFSVEGVFVLVCVFLEWFLASLWLVPGLWWACSGTSDRESVLCFVDTSQLSWWWGMPFDTGRAE